MQMLPELLPAAPGRGWMRRPKEPAEAQLKPRRVHQAYTPTNDQQRCSTSTPVHRDTRVTAAPMLVLVGWQGTSSGAKERSSDVRAAFTAGGWSDKSQPPR